MARSPDRVATCTAVGLLVFAAAACHHAASSPPTAAGTTSVAQPRALAGIRIGDTASFGAQIVALKAYPVTATRLPAFKATYTIAEPAWLVWLEIIPGKSIALLYPTSGSSMVMTPAGQKSSDFHYTAVAAAVAASVENKTEQARDDFYRCVDSAERAEEEAARRRAAAQPKPQPRRDKDGRVIEQPPPPIPTGGITAQQRKQIEARCQSVRPGSKGSTGDVVQAERYLVMLASYAPLTAAQLNTRLDALSVTASSVKGTVEAIAQGIYLDPHAVWAGHYVPW